MILPVFRQKFRVAIVDIHNTDIRSTDLEHLSPVPGIVHGATRAALGTCININSAESAHCHLYFSVDYLTSRI